MSVSCFRQQVNAIRRRPFFGGRASGALLLESFVEERLPDFGS